MEVKIILNVIEIKLMKKKNQFDREPEKLIIHFLHIVSITYETSHINLIQNLYRMS